MLMIAKDKIVLDPLVVYLQDMPVFMYPFGLFFSTKSGRRSGLVVPSFDISQSRGVVFMDFGYYFAASDYWDTQILGDYFSKGGFLVKNLTRWKYQDRFNGNSNIQYGKTRQFPDDPFSENYKIYLSSRFQISPNQNLTTNIDYSTRDFNRRNVQNINQRITQNITSNASYSLNLQKYGNFSVRYNRNQNIINDTYDQNPSVQYTLPNKSLGKLFGQDVVASYGFNANYSDRKSFNSFDSTYFNTTSSAVRHTPGISVNLPQIWNFRIQPNIGMAYNWFFRSIEREFIEEQDTVVEREIPGFFQEYFANFGVSLSTRFYGISQPNFWGIQAFRHTVEPTIRYTYTPDFSSLFYKSYVDSNGVVQKYNIYALDNGGAPSRQSQNISYAVNQKWEMKIDQGDSLDAKNLELLNVRFNGNYNFALDSNKFSDPRITFSTPALKFLNLSGSAGLSYYDQFLNGEVYSKSGTSLLDNNKFPVRFTDFSIGMSTSISDKGISLDQDIIAQDQLMSGDSVNVNGKMLGGRFMRRMNRKPEKVDMYGDDSPGFSPLNIPWNLSIGLNYSINSITPIDSREQLTTNGNLQFTFAETWDVNVSAQYDVIKKELYTPRISVSKRIQCWQMQFNWTPTGPHRSFYFRIGLSSSTFRDLQYEKRSTPVY